MGTKGWGRRIGEILVKRHRITTRQELKISKDLLCSKVTAVDDVFLKNVESRCCVLLPQKCSLCEVMHLLIRYTYPFMMYMLSCTARQSIVRSVN